MHGINSNIDVRMESRSLILSSVFFAVLCLSPSYFLD